MRDATAFTIMLHYHSRIHEVPGIARGHGKVQSGGLKGRTISMKGGDVAILPSGTGHQCLGASDDFLVIGAYPPNGTYDECTKSEDRKAALKTIPKVGRPRKDPVFGSDGPLLKRWRPRPLTVGRARRRERKASSPLNRRRWKPATQGREPAVVTVREGPKGKARRVPAAFNQDPILSVHRERLNPPQPGPTTPSVNLRGQPGPCAILCPMPRRSSCDRTVI